MFPKRRHTAEDLFRKSNRELKQLEREKRPSMSKPVPARSQDIILSLGSGPNANMKEEKWKYFLVV